jgi:Concanavalin A-like lectin/glucanases superfamily
LVYLAMRSRSPAVLATSLLAIALFVPDADAGPRPSNQPTPVPSSAAQNRPQAGVAHPVEIGAVPAQNKAIYLGYKGHIDTDVEFAEFFTADHTVMAWYMPQYPHGDTGPIVAENGSGTWAFGQDDYRLGDGDNGDAGSPVFFVQVGNKKVNYLLPEMIPGKWIHVAVVRKGDTVSLYVWGVKRTPVTVTNKSTNATSPAAEIKVSGASGLPSGKLRFGRRTTGSSGDKATWQAYGLIDDVAVFTKTLNGNELTSIIAAKRLKGNESGLLAGFSFEKKPQGGIALPSKLARPWTQQPRAYHMPVSDVRNSNDDRGVFDNPFVVGEVSAEVQLPFKKNEVWFVIQGQDDPSSSHNGYAAFCYDFMVANKPQTGSYPNGTAHAPVYAAATGKLVSYRKDGAFDGPREPYYTRIRVGEDEHIGYLHHEAGTLTDKAAGGLCNASTHDCDIAVASAPTLNQGAFVAKQGPKAAHLHFSGSGVHGESMTIPIAFTNYEASDDNGATWNHILRGHPKKGQLVKRTQ